MDQTLQSQLESITKHGGKAAVAALDSIDDVARDLKDKRDALYRETRTVSRELERVRFRFSLLAAYVLHGIAPCDVVSWNKSVGYGSSKRVQGLRMLVTFTEVNQQSFRVKLFGNRVLVNNSIGSMASESLDRMADFAITSFPMSSIRGDGEALSKTVEQANRNRALLVSLLNEHDLPLGRLG